MFARTSLAWPLAICARSCSTRAGILFSAEREEVSKSITVSYWPWWKALCMFRSSVRDQLNGPANEIQGSHVPPSAENGSMIVNRIRQCYV